MDITSVCYPQLAGSDPQNNTTSTPNAASVTDADKVIKPKLDSTQVEGDKREDELLKGLLTDDYCHVCEAVLLFESQRLSHYEGKKHAQKLKVYLQKKGAGKMSKESTGPQRTMTTDKDRFCELCNMVFSSKVVAKSHYEGKVHIKNLQAPDRFTEAWALPNVTMASDNADQKSAPERCVELQVDPAASTNTPNTEVDLKDPNRYCALCATSFNNSQMALQHFNGRKHQKNQARRELIKELGDDVQQASSLMCQMCSVQFNSLEMYQAHMQGNKHHVREKKVINLCKSQQKVYSTFADELADYIQVQKARGITPKANQVSLQAHKEVERKDEQLFNSRDVTDTNLYLHKHIPDLPPKPEPCYQFRTDSYSQDKVQHSQNQGPFWPPHGPLTNLPPPVVPGSDSLQFPGRTKKRRRHRKLSSSSSYTSSPSYSSNSSSYSSSTSDSDDTENVHRDRNRIRSRKDRCGRVRDEQRKRKQCGKERRNDLEERTRDESGQSDQERKRKKLKFKQRQQNKQSQEEDCELKREEIVMDSLKPEEMIDSKKQKVHIRTEIYVEQENDGQNESAKTKYRKEKKKMKEKVDTRTEEEKLWDDSILGC